MKKPIEDFTVLNDLMHKKKYVSFNPDISIENVGLYKRLEDCHEAITYIENQLTAYCYHGV